MAEYIEREAAIASAFAANALGNSAYRDVYDVVNRLRLVPAADVRPVVHGRWVETTNDVFHRIPTCLVCGTETLIKYNFCPNCGAKMDAPSRPEPSEEERAQIARRCGRENVD